MYVVFAREHYFVIFSFLSKYVLLTCIIHSYIYVCRSSLFCQNVPSVLNMRALLVPGTHIHICVRVVVVLFAYLLISAPSTFGMRWIYTICLSRSESARTLGGLTVNNMKSPPTVPACGRSLRVRKSAKSAQ